MPSFIIQQTIAVLAGPVSGFIIALLLLPLSSATSEKFSIGIDIILLLAGLAFGYLFSYGTKLSLKVAQWTWLLPLAGFVFVFVEEVQKFGLGIAINAFFRGQPSGEEGLALLFFSVPTWSAISYSMGAALRNYRESHASVRTHSGA